MPETPEASVAALIGSDLRAFAQFSERLDDLFVGGAPYHVFISTDARSLACAKENRLLKKPYIIWAGESPNTSAAILDALGPLEKSRGQHYHHLHQWWRLRHAWQHMERRERQRGALYEHVVRLRSDMRLPRPLELAPTHVSGLHGPAGEMALVMRGDWIFWGRREPMRVALEYVDELPRMHAIGQTHYMPLPWRHMLAVGPTGLSAGLFGWLKFPKATPERPFGLNGRALSSSTALTAHIHEHLSSLEAFERSLSRRGPAGAPRLAPSELISGRDGWWHWDGIPDNEKYFLYHVLNRSLYPRANMIDLYNHGVPAAARVTFLSNDKGLLVPEQIRHHASCTCVCPMAARPKA